MTDTIQRLGGSINAVVVQLPERAEPGVVVQRDGIQNLLDLVTEAKARLLANDWDEVRDVLNELEEVLGGYTSELAAI